MNVYFCGRLSNDKIYSKFEKLKFKTKRETPIEQMGIKNIFHAFNCIHFIGANNKIYNWNVDIDIEETNQRAQIYSSSIQSYSLKSNQDIVYSISVEENSYLTEVDFFSERIEHYQNKNQGQIDDARSTQTEVVFTTNNCIYDYQLKTGENLIKCTLRNLPKQISGVVSFFKVSQIACGNEHVLILSNYGHIYSYGSTQNGRLGYKFKCVPSPRSNKNADISYGEELYLDEVYQPQLIESIKGLNVLQISCGQSHNLALAIPRDQEYSLQPKNVVIVWGCNVQGSLGIGTNQDVEEPLINTYYDQCNPIRVECGLNYSLVLSDNGELTAFGGNEYGQLGQCHDISCSFPQKIDFENHQQIKSVFSSHFHCIAVTQNGNLYGWGNCWDGQLGIGELVQTQKVPRQADQSILNSQIIRKNINNMKMILTIDQSYFIIGDNQNNTSYTSTTNEINYLIDDGSLTKSNIISSLPSTDKVFKVQQQTYQKSYEAFLSNKSVQFMTNDSDISFPNNKSKSFFEEQNKNATKPTESPFTKINGSQNQLEQKSIHSRNSSKSRTNLDQQSNKYYLKKQSSFQDQQDYLQYLKQKQLNKNQFNSPSKSPYKNRGKSEESYSFSNQTANSQKVANPVTAKSIQEILKMKSETIIGQQILSAKTIKDRENQQEAQNGEIKRNRIFGPSTISPQYQQYFSQLAQMKYKFQIIISINRILDQDKKSKSEITLNQKFEKLTFYSSEEIQQFANKLSISKQTQKATHPTQSNIYYQKKNNLNEPQYPHMNYVKLQE